MTTILPGEYIDTRQDVAASAPIKRCTQDQVNTDPPNGILPDVWKCNDPGWETVYNENTIDSYKRLEYPPATAPDNYRSQYFNDDKIMIGQTEVVDFDTLILFGGDFFCSSNNLGPFLISLFAAIEINS